MIFLLAVLCGIVLGYARGGRLRDLAQVPHRLLILVWLALAMQIGLGFFPGLMKHAELRFSIVLSSYFLIAAWLIINMRDARTPRLGIFLLTTGWFLNLLVIAANGGMPVSRAALKEAGMDPDVDAGGHTLFKHVPASDDTSLYFLADVIPIRPLGKVISVGDIVLILGITIFIASAMVVSRASEASSRLMKRGSVPSVDQ
jgi:hypothetical protein